MKKDNEKEFLLNQGADGSTTMVSSAVIRRLPRYFRYLKILISEGRTRISSSELSRLMNVTASQIRQDLNCFGGFGQQGYGYNVNYLYAKICEILGVGDGFCAIIIGSGNLGKALAKSPMFERRGVDVVAMFDVDSSVVGTEIGNVKVYHLDELERFCDKNRVDIAVMTMPKENAENVFERLLKMKMPGVWNFTGRECISDNGFTVVEDIHLGDSLMTLCYELTKQDGR